MWRGRSFVNSRGQERESLNEKLQISQRMLDLPDIYIHIILVDNLLTKNLLVRHAIEYFALKYWYRCCFFEPHLCSETIFHFWVQAFSKPQTLSVRRHSSNKTNDIGDNRKKKKKKKCTNNDDSDYDNEKRIHTPVGIGFTTAAQFTGLFDWFTSLATWSLDDCRRLPLGFIAITGRNVTLTVS